MAYIVLFSFIVLPWTICVVNGAVSSHERCIIKSSSRYSVVSQYCTSESILELKVKQAKEDVCDEMLQLYDQMCSFNRSSTAFDWPEPHNVSKTNCLSICAELDTKYISRMFDEGSGSCVTLCTKDLEAVAVLSTLFQLKDFIAELKKNQTVETVTNSTSEQSASSPGAEGNKSSEGEPDSKPSTAATGENASASIEAVTTLRPVATEKTTTLSVKTATEKKKVPSTKLVPNLTTTATTRPSPAKSAVKSTTPTEKVIEPNGKPDITEKMNVSSAKPDLNATTTAAAENGSALKEASTNLKPINTAAEQIYSTPKEEDRTLKPVATGKTPSPNLKINTTGERIVSSPNKDVKKTGLDNEPEKASEDVDEQEDLDKTTNSKEEQEDLDKTTNSKKEQEDLDKTTNSKKEQEDLDKTTNSKKEQEDLDKTTNSKKEQEDLDKTTNSKKEQEDLDKTTNSKKEQDDLDKTTNSKEEPNMEIKKPSSHNDKPDTENEITENEITSLDDNKPINTDEKDQISRLDDTPSSYHFLIYFLAFIVLCVAAYIVFHNKHKIIAFIIEGKQGRRGGRPSTKQYTPLKSKVEDVMPFIEKSTTQSNYIY